jgi:hypothetical protein
VGRGSANAVNRDDVALIERIETIGDVDLILDILV